MWNTGNEWPINAMDWPITDLLTINNCAKNSTNSIKHTNSTLSQAGNTLSSNFTFSAPDTKFQECASLRPRDSPLDCLTKFDREPLDAPHRDSPSSFGRRPTICELNLRVQFPAGSTRLAHTPNTIQCNIHTYVTTHNAQLRPYQRFLPDEKHPLYFIPLVACNYTAGGNHNNTSIVMFI